MSSRDTNSSSAQGKFFIFTHPLLPQRIIYDGFSWPAFFFGPAWLLFKKVWPALGIAVLILGFVDYSLVSGLFCPREYYTYRDTWVPSNTCMEGNKDKELWLLLIVHFFIGIVGNDKWKEDLIKRGYLLSRYVNARSVDDAAAIIAREAK